MTTGDAVTDPRRFPGRVLAGLRGPWGMVIGLWLMIVGAAAYEIAPASVTPLLMEGLGVGPTGASWVVSVMFGTAVVTSVPIGIGLDRTDTRVATALGVVTLVVAGVWGWRAAAAGDYASLLASRVVGATAFTVIWNAGAHLIGHAFDVRTRATAIGVFTAGGTAGFALGQAAGPIVAAAFGWTAIFAAFGGVSVGGLGLFWTARHHGAPGPDDGGAPSVGEFARVLTDGTVWYVCVMGFLAYSVFLFLNTWMPTYLTGELGMTLARGGLVVALFAGVGILARTGGGLLSDRVFAGRRRPVAVLSFASTAPLIVAIALTRDVTLVFVILVVSGFAVQLGVALFYAYVREVVPAGVAATAVSVMTAVSLFGGFSAPIVTGFLIERTGGFLAAFGYAAVLAAIGLVMAVFAPEPN